MHAAKFSASVRCDCRSAARPNLAREWMKFCRGCRMRCTPVGAAAPMRESSLAVKSSSAIRRSGKRPNSKKSVHDVRRAMKIKSGIKRLAEIEGQGEPAKKGDTVIYNWRLYRNHGDEIPLNEQQAKILPREIIRHVDGRPLVDHKAT